MHASVAIPSPVGLPPGLPSTLGEPALSYARDPETDTIILTVHTPASGEIEFRRDGNTFDDGLYEGRVLSRSERDALITYGRQVRENVDVAAFAAEDGVRKAIEDEVLAIATGRAPEAEHTALGTSGHLVRSAAARTAKILGAWVDDVDTEPETATKDALTDLIHFARWRGLDPQEIFERALEQAEGERDEDGDPRGQALETSEA
ncbi:hypothetical protein HNR08_003400 [Cellulomonas hominis]|uniref:Uncharacterized protein n=1 Tax=Cellulomonas hominis TaxID=156981 RepID=A0A7W8WBF7_9CELL|nr:hypothetical protein [Cellulomonas hominis]MBB5474664.1 hypothetical protein [Cellulomonas hominis]